jgi:hypothetical protein
MVLQLLLNTAQVATFALVYLLAMRILERVQAFLPLLTIEIF